MRALTALLLVVLLASCAAPQTRVINTACVWQFSASPADTPDTKREILAFAKWRQENCPPASNPDRSQK